jgi:hypothetical protein
VEVAKRLELSRAPERAGVDWAQAAKVVLKALTTFAPGALAAISCAADPLQA